MDRLQNNHTDTLLDSDKNVNLVFLHPNYEQCLGRVPSLSKVDGLESNEVEVLNNWFLDNWRGIYTSGFLMNESLTRDFTHYLQLKSPILVDLEKVESYLAVQKLLYNGLRLELSDENENENISQCKLFHKYYYSCRENPLSLNNLIVLSNVIWSLKKYRRDEFALTCLVDILLQSYMVALNSFISLGGVAVLRETLEFLANNQKLKQSTNFLLKCMDLLDKLDINYKVLQTSKIGVPVNCIALGKSHAKLKLDYECSNDKVKLKATNLIKKWKAIRDASLPAKASMEPDNKLKKVLSSEGRLMSKKSMENAQEKKGDKMALDKKVNEKKDTVKTSQVEGQNNEPEGSFVLNIINTMVEQKEKEKKRKMEIRNSQLSSKYKTTTKGKTEMDSKPEKNGSVEINLSSTSGVSSMSNDKLDKSKSMEEAEKKELKGSATETEKEKSSTTQLASLMNFFKEYSNKTDENQEEAPATANHNHRQHNQPVQKQNLQKNQQGSVSSKLGSASAQPASVDGQFATTNLTGQAPNSAAQQLASSSVLNQLGQTVTSKKQGQSVMSHQKQQAGSSYVNQQYAHTMPTQVASNVTHMGPNAQQVGSNLHPQLPSSSMGPLGYADVTAQQVPPPVAPQMLTQVPPPVSPPPVMSNIHVHQQYPMSTTNMPTQPGGVPKHLTGGFTSGMDASNEQHVYGKKDYRNMAPDQANMYISYPVYGNMMPPTGYAPPPPPPPPAPPVPQHYASTPQEATSSFDSQNARFFPPRSNFSPLQPKFHQQPANYEEAKQEGYIPDKNMEFYRGGTEKPRQENQGTVFPPWK